MLSIRIKTIFDRVIDFVFSIILLFIIVAIAIGTVQLFVSLWQLLAFEGITGKYIGLISDVLTLYVLIELSRSLVEYFDTSKLRLTFIVDAAIVFIIRELPHHAIQASSNRIDAVCAGVDITRSRCIANRLDYSVPARTDPFGRFKRQINTEFIQF